jgi:hypothetical protein
MKVCAADVLAVVAIVVAVAMSLHFVVTLKSELVF